MIDLSLQIKGQKLVSRGLDNLHAKIPKIGKYRLKEAAETIVRKMQKYPSQRPNQTYIRTYLFRNSWKVQALPTGYTVTNSAQKDGVYYGGYVVGDIYGAGQAWMHVGRWQLLNTVVMDVVDRLPKAVMEDLQTEARTAFAGEAFGI